MNEHTCPYPASGCTHASCDVTAARQAEIDAERAYKATAERNARYQVNVDNPAPGFLDRAERALDDMFYDDEQFCRRCLAGVHSSEHAEKCYYPGHAEMGESA